LIAAGRPVFAARSFEAQKDTPALAAPFESAKQGVHFAAKRTTPARNFATKKREKAAFLLAKSKQTSAIPQKFQNVNPFLKNVPADLDYRNSIIKLQLQGVYIRRHSVPDHPHQLNIID
jgi:hypothetical protein